MDDIITVDGPSGSGKSTVSRILAKKLGILYLDTGAMYRAVALMADRTGVKPGDRERLGDLCRHLDLRMAMDAGGAKIALGEEDISAAIRSPAMDMLSSTISSIGEVRRAMVDLQRKMALRGGLVAEGRDMGTVVFPGAPHKFFLTASTQVRARRRYLERVGRGERVREEDVAADLVRRDNQDSTRALAPLLPAEDAVIIDTGAMDAEHVVRVMERSILESRK